MIKAVLLPFLQPALKRQGSWEQTGRRGREVRALSPEPSAPGRAPKGAEEEEDEDDEGSPQPRGFAFQFCSH